MTTLLDSLRRIVGDTNVLTHDDPTADLSAWEQDWRKRVRGTALAVVRPGSTEQVAQVALCVLLFVACAAHVRIRLAQSKAKLAASA